MNILHSWHYFILCLVLRLPYHILHNCKGVEFHFIVSSFKILCTKTWQSLIVTECECQHWSPNKTHFTLLKLMVGFISSRQFFMEMKAIQHLKLSTINWDQTFKIIILHTVIIAFKNNIILALRLHTILLWQLLKGFTKYKLY